MGGAPAPRMPAPLTDVMRGRDAATLSRTRGNVCDGSMSSPTIRAPRWRRPFALIRENRRTYAIITGSTYGLFAIGS